MTTPNSDSLNDKARAAGAGLRLLVIDDDRKLCRLIRDYLEPMGYSVTAVHTGPDGVQAAAAGHARPSCWT